MKTTPRIPKASVRPLFECSRTCGSSNANDSSTYAYGHMRVPQNLNRQPMVIRSTSLRQPSTQPTSARRPTSNSAHPTPRWAGAPPKTRNQAVVSSRHRRRCRVKVDKDIGPSRPLRIEVDKDVEEVQERYRWVLGFRLVASLVDRRWGGCQIVWSRVEPVPPWWRWSPRGGDAWRCDGW
jgi:hypothetical protein